MFKNIGKKIKGLAKIVCWIGIICSIIAGITFIVGSTRTYSFFYGSHSYVDPTMIFMGLAIMIGGSLTSWIGSFVVYGFGELVDSATTIKECMCVDKSESSLDADEKRLDVLYTANESCEHIKKMYKDGLITFEEYKELLERKNGEVK